MLPAKTQTATLIYCVLATMVFFNSCSSALGGIGLPKYEVPNFDVPIIKPIEKAREVIRKIDPTDKNSESRKGLRKIDPTNKNSKVREGLRKIDKDRLDAIRRGEHAVSDKAYFAYKNHVISKNRGNRPIAIRPGTLHYDMIANLLPQGFPLNQVRIYFGAYVPANMAGVTFGRDIYIDPPHRPNSKTQGLLIAHELAHVWQYERLGSEKAFARRYFGQIGGAVRSAILRGNFNITFIHDALGLEKEADGFAETVRRVFENRSQQRIARKPVLVPQQKVQFGGTWIHIRNSTNTALELTLEFASEFRGWNTFRARRKAQPGEVVAWRVLPGAGRIVTTQVKGQSLLVVGVRAYDLHRQMVIPGGWGRSGGSPGLLFTYRPHREHNLRYDNLFCNIIP